MIILVGGLRGTTSMTKQMPDTRAVVKALYIYTFATLVEWPKEKRSGEFVIGVLGDKTSVYEELVKKYSGKSIGTQEIVIENYPEKNMVKTCHILYVTESNTQYMKSLSSQLAPKNTLLVGEQTGALSSGAVVNFIVDGNRQKYEINKKNAKKHNLVIADKLSNLAANVIK